MAPRSKTHPHAVRQSVTIPAPLAQSIRRVALQHRWTMSKTVVVLAERGMQADAESKRSLARAHRRFLAATAEADQAAAGRDLMRAIFGENAIAEDPLL